MISSNSILPEMSTLIFRYFYTNLTLKTTELIVDYPQTISNNNNIDTEKIKSNLHPD